MSVFVNLIGSTFLLVTLSGCVTTGSISDSLSKATESVKSVVFGKQPKEYADSDPISVMNPSKQEMDLLGKYGLTTIGHFKSAVLEMKESGYFDVAGKPSSYMATFTYLEDRETAKQQADMTPTMVLQARQEEAKRIAARKKMTVQQIAPKGELGLFEFCTGYLIEAHAVMRDQAPKLRLNAPDRASIKKVTAHLDRNTTMFLLAGTVSMSDLTEDEKKIKTSQKVRVTREGVQLAKTRINNDPMKIIMPGRAKEDVKSCLEQSSIAQKYLRKAGL